MPDKPTFIEYMRGKRTRNIELPNDTGQRDPRLPARTTFKDIKQGYDAVRGLVDARPKDKKK